MPKMKPGAGEKSGSSKSSHPLEKVKTDIGNVVTPRKNSGSSSDTRSEKGESRTPKPLCKNLSKSHDNLASTLRRKAAQEKANLAGNKENFGSLRTASPAPKFKTPKTPSTPIHKSQAAQAKNDTPIKRARSAQNICDAEEASQVTSKGTVVKRASSTQNVSNKGKNHVRVVSTPANAMAYNAELLASFEKEKKALERRISELIQIAEGRKTDVEKLKYEVKNLKSQIPDQNHNDEFEMLRNENRLLKDRLHELGVPVEHITDSEKLSLLQKANRAKDDEAQDELRATTEGSESSVGVKWSIVPHRGDGSEGVGIGTTIDSELGLSLGDLTCITSDHPSSLDNNWDKQSNKSSDAMSEVSVACLQDRIFQMEENHYSTSEELQATLQELTDLQDAVNELTNENERLADEKSVLLESLCAQTEKLENARMQIEHLKVLLVSDSEGGDRSENERQLVNLLKSGQEEREELLLKQIEYSNSLHAYENENREIQDIINALRDKVQILELKNESILADKRALDSENADLKEHGAKDQIEIQRFNTLLENEKQKVTQLEQERNATDKSDIEAILDDTRRDKGKLEKSLSYVQKDFAISKNEVSRLKEQISSLSEELKVSKNNAKSQVSDVEYKLEKMTGDKRELQGEVDTLRDHIDQLQLDCDRYLDEKKTHGGTLTKLEFDHKSATQRIQELEGEMRMMKSQFRDEQDEWKQFQLDLQTAVVIANDIKSETQEDMEKAQEDNAKLKEKNKELNDQMSRIRDDFQQLKILVQQQQRNDTIMTNRDIRGRVFITVDRELAALRHGRKMSDPKGGNPSLSVKNLIQSIEEQVKSGPSSPPGTPPLSPATTPTQESSRRNSVDTPLVSVKSDTSPLPKPVLERRCSAPIDSSSKNGILRRPASEYKEGRSPLGHRHTISNIILESPSHSMTDDAKKVAGSPSPVKETEPHKKGILSNKLSTRKSSFAAHSPGDAVDGKADGKSPGMYSTPTTVQGVKSDPLAALAKQMGGSKRNALLKWCQMKTASYSNIDITNFSSSWNDGLAFSALMHTYLPDKITYKELNSDNKLRNFSMSFKAAESVGIQSILNVNDMASMERPDWQAVMTYITSIYKHFEVDNKQ